MPRLLVALGLLLFGSAAWGSSMFAAHEAQYQDPRKCPAVHEDLCTDAAANAALSAFPYWGHLSTGPTSNQQSMLFLAGSGDTLFLTGGGDATPPRVACFAHGAHQKKCYDVVSRDRRGFGYGWRTLGQDDDPGSRPGAWIARYRRQSKGPAVPSLPRVRLLPPEKAKALPDGLLLLSTAAVSMPPSLDVAVYEQCARQYRNGYPKPGDCDEKGEHCAPGGTVPGGRKFHACCLDPPYPYDLEFDATTPLACRTAMGEAFGGGHNPVCWGAPGRIRACEAAGLTYVMPLPAAVGAYLGDRSDGYVGSRVVWIWHLERGMRRRGVAEGSPRAAYGSAMHATPDGTVMKQEGICARASLNDWNRYPYPWSPADLRALLRWVPPRNARPFDQLCAYRETLAFPGSAGFAPIAPFIAIDDAASYGNSNTQRFVWYENAWWYIGPGKGGANFGPAGFPAQHRRVLDWIGAR